VWDEPNNGVDVMANMYIRSLLERIRAEGKTIILSSHVIEFMAGLVDSVTVLDEGLVAARACPAPGDLRGFFLSALGPGRA